MTDWNEYAKHGDLRSVIDPADNLGYKNAYINLLQHKLLSTQMGSLKGKRVLDLGCGIGRFSGFLQSKGAIVTGVDSCQDMLKFNITCTTVCSPITKLPFKDGSFDIILSVWTLQYLCSLDLKMAISEINRVLSPEGTIYFIEQLTLSGYDGVFPRTHYLYDDYLLRSGFSKIYCRPVNSSLDKIIGIIRFGKISKYFFKYIIPVHLIITKFTSFPRNSNEDYYVDYFMKIKKVDYD